MSPMTNLWRGLTGLLGLALLTLPFQQAWIRPLAIAQAPSWVTFILTGWAAPLLLLLAVAAFWRLRPVAKVDYWLIAFFILAGLPAIWSISAIPDLVIGWRYTVFAMLGYWIGRGRFATLETLERWLHISLWLVIGFSGVQLIAWWLGDQSIITTLGLEPTFAAGDWWRLFGPMSGPNQLGTFLAISGSWLYWRGRLSRRELVIVVVLTVLTFSRSALLGFAAGLLIPGFVFARGIKQRFWLAGALVLSVLVAMMAIALFPTVREGLVDARRADLRLTLIEDTVEHFSRSSSIEWLIGHGAGSAGPAAAVLDNGGFIPENWFLQVAYEFGILGLVAILGFFGSLVWLAVRRRQPAIMAIVITMAINCLFLHPLSDNFATALWFYVLVGAAVSRDQSELQ